MDKTNVRPLNLRARRFRTSTKLGVFTAATVGLVALIAGTITQVTVSSEYRLTAIFDDVNGLVEGDKVKIAGSPVGKVDQIEVVDGRARVTLLVEDRVHVPVDSEASIRWRNAIGQRVVYLNPGKDGKMLADGSTVPRTKSVVDVGDLLTDLEQLAGQREAGWANQLIEAFSKSLEGNEGNADQLMANVEAVTKSVAARKATINQMITDYKDVSTVIARRDKQIATMLDNLVALSGAFARNRQLVDSALVELSGMVSTTDKVLGQNAEALGQIIGQAGTFTAGVRRNVSTLERLINELPAMLQRTHTPVADGGWWGLHSGCLSLSAGPSCAIPMELPGQQKGAGKLDSEKALRSALVGP